MSNGQLAPFQYLHHFILRIELNLGVSKSTQPDRNREALAEFLLPLEVLPFDENASYHYGDIRSTLEKMGNVIGSMDLLIAAHARSLSLTLMTNNLREFERVPGLRTNCWAGDIRP